MLRRLFPPPHPPDLCTALNPAAAVAHGAAIQAAIISGYVPRHEIMSALMLDALPHTIGILVEMPPLGNENEKVDQGEEFIPVLFKDDPLPTSNYKTFQLSHASQKGVTIPVVEFVGGGYPYQTIGELTFLLHKLSNEELDRVGSVRTVDVAMAVDSDGNLTVSLFDWNDPDHLAKRRRYLASKGMNKVDHDTVRLSNTQEHLPQEQILLVLACLALGGLYLFAKIIFRAELSAAEL